MRAYLDELATVHYASKGYNLSRFGDGELRLAVGGKAINQRANPKLAKELRLILAGNTKAIPCIPPQNVWQSPRRSFWKKYTTPQYEELYTGKTYGSSFITRPDSAPWIDTPYYWELVQSLWKNRSIIFVTGGDNRLPEIIGRESKSLELIPVSKTDAYDCVDELVTKVKGFHGTVLLACGAAATVAAHRLAEFGTHAVDIGHMGMFYTVQGAYAMKPEQLATTYYRQQLQEAHKVKKWGGGGYSWAETALKYRKEISASNMLDYGCGQGTFKKKVLELSPKAKVTEYDPGIPGKEAPPKPVDLVVCTDVLEHIEPECLDAVLNHTFKVGRKGAFFVIAKGPANKCLPDGRNAHLIQEKLPFWKKKLDAVGWSKVTYEDTRKHVLAWAEK